MVRFWRPGIPQRDRCRSFVHMREIYVESRSNGVRLYIAKHAGSSPLSNSFIFKSFFFFFSLDMYGIGLKNSATAI